jgi:hypothetical protein
MLLAERALAAGLGEALDDQRRERSAAALPGERDAQVLEHLVLGVEFAHQRIPVRRTEAVHQRVDDIPTGREHFGREVALGEIAQPRDLAQPGLRHALEPHGPIRVLAALDLLAREDADVVMPGVARDAADELVDHGLVALDDLQEGAVAVEQHAGDAASGVVRVALLQQRQQLLGREGR